MRQDGSTTVAKRRRLLRTLRLARGELRAHMTHQGLLAEATPDGVAVVVVVPDVDRYTRRAVQSEFDFAHAELRDATSLDGTWTLIKNTQERHALLSASWLIDFVGGVKAALVRLIVLLHAALSQVVDTPTFVLIVLAVCRRHGHRQEPADAHFPLIRRIRRAGIIATVA